jgi:hypothetical protein
MEKPQAARTRLIHRTALVNYEDEKNSFRAEGRSDSTVAPEMKFKLVDFLLHIMR